ncbi:MAG: PDZ domain-containing protein [Deferribacteraceae bacterium]|jgi:type II secretion system protein C|nr:PDZ domain-containing protein [Deferribacteraceae bacterium]
MKALKYTDYLYIVCIAFFLAGFVSRAIEYNVTKPYQLPPIKPFVSKVNDASRAQTAAEITERNLLDADKFEPPPDTPEAIAQSAPFNGKLTGILLAKLPEDSCAIIVVSDKDVYVLNTYKEQDGYKLRSATFDTAVIMYNDREYTLTLENNNIITSAPQSPATNLNQPASAQGSSDSGNSMQFTLKRVEVLERFKNINEVVRSLLASPLYNGSEYQGYRIIRMDENSPVKQLGLQLGDVINRINGEDLQEGPKLLFDIMNRIDEVDAITLDVTRNGEKKSLFVEIQ